MTVDTGDIDPWYLQHLRCPRDRRPLVPSEGGLRCAHGHDYPVIEGLPVMLVAEAGETIGIAGASIAAADHPDPDGLYVDTLSLSDDERRGITELARSSPAVDPVAAFLVAATNGLMYRHLIGTLARYPIPDLSLPAGSGRRLLDIGCSWGRWTVAAGLRGYTAVGIDPSLGAVLAARRVARAMNAPARFVVGDARHLPFADGTFETAYSYSVLQHLSYSDADTAAREIGRVLATGGVARVQMPTQLGVRCLYHQARRRFRTPQGFEVRYWPLSRLRRVFERAVGPVRFDVDGYFGIGLQASDAGLMPPSLALVLRASNAVRALSRFVPPLRWVADSVFVHAVKAA